MVNKTEKSVTVEFKAFSLRTIKVCPFEIIDGVYYVYYIKHAYKFLLREQVWFTAVIWRLRQCVSLYFFEYEHLKRVVWIDDNVFGYKPKIGNRAYFPTWR